MYMKKKSQIDRIGRNDITGQIPLELIATLEWSYSKLFSL